MARFGSAVGVPRLQRGQRVEGVTAVVPARRAPKLEVQMAPVGVARLADGAYPLAGVDAVARVERRRLGEVHVDIVDAGAVSIDDDVVACQAVVALELHASAAGGHHRRATTGHHVLTLVGVPGAPGAEASGRLAVVVLAADGELVIEEVEGIAGEIADLGTACDGPGASSDG